ncbi:MAG: phosphoribosylformylglycinamidine synthase subunit PurL [Saprospiraceae bacterium]|nr:phosphoribosylformylglycinamidine synthase subunit PurL [Saprospiraceae bacterium]MCF8248322.1 phosphoribosylformylglycinamidine synthase subunit PurL [Saprospiraceae bacterium]MCF8280239.1 phosphoribosylformylglycinamidine synthase subunit PurL [Bacteroidales bacterium]MCF8309850.1 phosphoribosylformylglycinamidine synthase subunit PurL [Saprospiraceae bacterium]MCF8438819.1 phosphoribosylformylglycinamidine synthase subunit PurL [Saprospiraceae bacterium]
MHITESEITEQTAAKLGLTAEEFEKIKQVLGRTPNFVELSIYSVMWSEHCSYKNSIKWLKTLPREGKRLLVGAGEENAGLVDIGDGIACAFKIESHNHPSAIEPYQGAATGVGGIHRDIFTMGARPIAALNSLRFGNPDAEHMKGLVKGVVKGIGDYGNSFGVPTVAGEVFFDESYNQNILVNAMSVGIVKIGETVSACADGPGNPVFIVGSATGKDGIHGATFASADLHDESHEDLPAVQVGDPFQEKLLLEASLEAIKTGAVVGMQDMGAAGITCSTSEMSAKSDTGMRIDLSKVPTRQANMLAWEILLSESQERMLIVGKAGQEQPLLEVFQKWDLECVQIGEVTDTGLLEYFYEGKKVAEVPAESLVLGGGAPVYDRDFSKPAYLSEVSKFRLNKIDVPTDIVAAAKKLFSLPNLVSKRWVYEQYDSMVRTNNLSTNAPSDAAVLRIKGSKKSLVVTVDCNPAYVQADPYTGAMIAVAEAARNITCTGGVPVAITNCLNFGNPYNPEVYYQFVHAIKGMGEACRKFNTPVTGGNVSFYNQSEVDGKTAPVFPTPTIGMLGILEDPLHQTTLNFKEEGDVIYMLGNIMNDLGSSEYLRNVLGVKNSPAPYFDLHEEFELQQLIRNLILKNWLNSAHDVSDGGLFTNLMESAITSGLGFNIETVETFRKDCFLFGESQSRVVISLPADKEDELQNFLINNNLSFTKLGEVFGTEVVIDDKNYGSVAGWKLIFDNTLGEKFD